MERIWRSAHWLAFGLLAAWPGALSGQELAPPEHYRLRLEYVRWFPSLEAELQKGSGDSPGTRIDAQLDLGIEDRQRNEFKGELRLGARHKLRGAYTPLDYRAEVVTSRPFVFDGTFFRRDSSTVSRLKGGLWSGEYELDLLKGGWGHLGLLIGAKFLDVDAVIVQPDEGRRETGTLRAPVPVVGAAGRIYSGRLSLSGEISGLTIGSRGTLYDVQGHARYHISDRLALGGGYRLISVRGEDGSDFIRLRNHGLRFVVELSL